MNNDYQTLAKNIRRCSSCSFRDSTIEPLPPVFVSKPVPIMFIGENPSWADGQDVLFAESTLSGQALNKYYLKPLGLQRNQVWITDLFKCRYPKEIYHSKTENDDAIQMAASTCAHLWLLREIEIAQPKVIVTLSNKEVYQRLRRAFDLPIEKTFNSVVGKPQVIKLDRFTVTLFPMIHPDISRPIGDGDNRKRIAREKWSSIHHKEHIPALKKLL